MPELGLAGAGFGASRGLGLAAREALDEDHGTLTNFFNFLSRPGFATRSLLRGDVEGMLRNIGQFANDLPFAGALTGIQGTEVLNLPFRALGQGEVLPEQIANREHMPEATDLLHSYGLLNKDDLGTWERLGIDIAGGIVTDPLTLLSGGGKGIVQGGLTTLPKAAARGKVAAALRETAEGTRELAKASRSVLDNLLSNAAQAGRVGPPQASSASKLGGLFNSLDGDFDKLLGISDEAIRAFDDTLDPTHVKQLIRGIEERAAENIFWDVASESMPKVYSPEVLNNLRRLGEAADGGLLDDGIKALERAGLTETPGTMYWKIPFAHNHTRKPVNFLPSPFWSTIGAKGTAPGWVRGGLHYFDKTRPLAQTIDSLASESWAWVKSLYDRFDYGKVPAGAKEWIRKLTYDYAGADKEIKRKGIEILGNLDDTAAEEVGTAMLGAEEVYRALVNPAGDPDGVVKRAISSGAFNFTRAGFDDWDSLRTAVEEGTASVEDLAKFAKEPNLGLAHPQLLKALKGAANKDYAKEVVEEMLKRQDPERYLSVIQPVLEEFRKIPSDLVRLGVWKNAHKASPFYFPHQGEDILFELLNETTRNVKLKEGLRALGDPFTKSRKELPDFVDGLHWLAREHGIDLDDLREAGESSSGWINKDIRSLFMRRMMAHNKTMYRAGVMEFAKKAGMKEGGGDALGTYLDGILSPGNFRENVVGKILGGGYFRVPASAAPGLRAWAEKMQTTKGSTFVPRILKDKGGKEVVRIHWPGVNLLWKPLLTSFPTNLAFHVRNATSAAFMSMFDPDIGRFSGFPQLWHSFRNSGIVRKLGVNHSNDEIARVVRYLDADTPEAIKAAREGIKQLSKSGRTVGSYSWDEVLDTLDKGLAHKISQADLMQDVGNIDVFFREVFDNGNRASQGFRKLVKLGQDMANSIEHRFRANFLLEALQKGVSPQEAIRRMNRAFIDYSVQGSAEQFLRDVFPFARFTIGSTAWIKSIAEEPRLVSWMARAQSSVRDSSQEELGFLPERAEGTLALPLPWKDSEGNLQFLLGLGLPAETAINILGISTPDGFRRQVLGAMHPLGRLPLEAATDRNFFFGTEFGDYRRVPEWLKEMPVGAFRRVEFPNGQVRWEMDGRINEIFNALPTSRQQSIVDKLLRGLKGGPASTGYAAFNVGTGGRTLTVRKDVELKRRLASWLRDRADQGQVEEAITYFVRAGDQNAEMPADLRAVLEEYNRQRSAGRKKKTLGLGGLGFR